MTTNIKNAYIISIISLGLILGLSLYFQFLKPTTLSLSPNITPNQQLPSPNQPDDVGLNTNLAQIDSNQSPIKISASATAPVKISARPQYLYRALTNTTQVSLPSGMQANYLQRINQPLAYSLVQVPIKPVTIAIIDTGFMLNHEVFQSKWAINDLDPADSIDNDNNGYVDDYLGWDFVGQDNQPLAGTTAPNAFTSSHGTLVASLAIAQNPQARLLPLQVLDDNGDGYTDAVAEAIHYAVDNGASVINISLGSTETDTYLQAQIDYALARGVVVVAAAGNDGCNCMLFPARYAPVIAVGASNGQDQRASFSSYGSNIDLLAPGVAGEVCGAIYSPATTSSSYSCSYSGTSLSAPIVSGAISLLQHHFPRSKVGDIQAALNRGADQLPAMLNNDFTPTEGYGRLNDVASIGLMSINPPGGLLTNKHTLALSANEQITSTCLGYPDSVCRVKLQNKSGQIIYLPTQPIVSQNIGLPYTSWVWSPNQTGLSKGIWVLQAQTIFDNQVIYSNTETLLIQ